MAWNNVHEDRYANVRSCCLPRYTHTKIHVVSRLPSDKHTMFDRHKQMLYVHGIHSFCALSSLFFLPDHVYLPGCEVKACLVLTVLLCFLQVSHILLLRAWADVLHHAAHCCSSGKKFTDFIIYRNHPLWNGLHENRLLFWCSQFKVWRYLLGKCFLWPSYKTCQKTVWMFYFILIDILSLEVLTMSCCVCREIGFY